MIRIKLLLSYDGSSFYGWQKQNHSSLTIQTQLEQTWSKIYNEKISVVGSSRTDAGVHALGQVAHLDVPQVPSYKILKSVNSLLPSSIVCHCLWLAPKEFHAQRSACLRSYSYYIFNTQTPSAIRRNLGLWYPFPVDLKKLNQMARHLVGKNDFKSFQNKGTSIKDTSRIVKEATWSWARPGVLVFRISADGFLKQMVRNLVGSQLEWMQEGVPNTRVSEVLELKSRKEAGKTAPAQGLFLEKVSYPHSLDRKCQKL